MLSGRRPANLGANGGRLAPPKRTPNCVSSQADPADAEHYIAAIRFAGDATQAMAAARQVLQSMERATVVRDDGVYIHAEFRSRLLGYVDDVELLFDEKAGAFHVRSASRLGRRDFGVNRKRIESLRTKLQRS